MKPPRPRRSLLARAGLAIVAALLAALGAGGCTGTGRAGGGDSGGLLVHASLLVVDAREVIRGEGSFWLRVLPQAGAAVERRFEWRLAAAPPEGDAAGKTRAIELLPGRDGLPPGAALYEGLAPGPYRLSSFLLSGRLEKRAGAPLLTSLSGDLSALAPVDVRAGELSLAGRIDVRLSLAGRYEYQVKAPDAAASAEVRRLRPGLASLLDVPRPVARQGGDAASGEALAARPSLGPRSGRERAAVPLGEPRSRGSTPDTVDPSSGSAPAEPGKSLDLGARASLVLGFATTLGSAFSEAESGAGTIRLELRRVGGGVAVADIGWELATPEARTQGAAVSLAGVPGPDGRRALTLVSTEAVTGTAAAGLVLAFDVLPGEFELSRLELAGTVRSTGVDRRVAGAVDVSRAETFPVAAGEIVDLGALAVDLTARDRLTLRVHPESAEARIEAARTAARPEGARGALQGASRPLRRGEGGS